jgi:uncharacterized integral membrane protein
MSAEPPERIDRGGGPRKGISPEQGRQLVRIGIIVVIAILILGFVFENGEDTEVSFLFFGFSLPLLLLMILCFAVGFIVGRAWPWLWRGFQQWRASRAAR